MKESTSTFGATSIGSQRAEDGQRTDYRGIVDGVPGCILVADANGQVIYANRVAVATLGRPLEELLGCGWLTSLDPSFVSVAQRHWEHCIQLNEPLDVTWRFRQHDGAYRWQHLKAEPTAETDRTTLTWYVLGVDEDEQVKAQEALKASEQEAREILDRVPAMISIWTEGGIAYSNKRLSDFLGSIITDLRDGSYLDYLHPDDRDAVNEFMRSPQTGPKEIVYRSGGKDGIYRWFHSRAEPYVNEDGSIYRWYTLNSDIDDLYRSRDLLLERELQLNLLTETLPALLWKAEPDGTLVYINRKTTEYTGRTLPQLQRDGWSDLVHPDDLPETLRLWHQLLGGSDGYDDIHRILGTDGRYRWFHTSVAVVRDANGKAVAFHAVMLDTTAQKNAELALQESERQMQRMMDTVPSMLWSTAPNGSTTFINRRARDYCGLSLKQVKNWEWLETVHPDEQDDYARAFRRALLEGVAYEAEVRIRRADGVYRWHLNRAEPLRDEDGQIIQWFGVDIDIDDQKRAEERLRDLRINLSQTSRTSMGAELSASIAHEINQPLTSVLANAQACAHWLSAAPPNIQEAIRSVELVVRDGRAADAVIRNIRSLFKRQPSVKAPCNMVDLIRDALSLVKEDVNRRSTPIKLIHEEMNYTVLVDRFQIQQVIVNLVGNAIEAMEESDRPSLLQICIRRIDDGRVLTEFIDNGRGLPADSMDNIFDAFVTTKKNGMGIGLAISRSIVEAHEGDLLAENNPDFGAKFSLFLKPPRIQSNTFPLSE